MRAGWINIGIGLLQSRASSVNWFRVNGLALAVSFSVAVWVLLAILALK